MNTKIKDILGVTIMDATYINMLGVNVLVHGLRQIGLKVNCYTKIVNSTIKERTSRPKFKFKIFLSLLLLKSKEKLLKICVLPNGMKFCQYNH